MRGLYALPPGVDFAAEVVRGLQARMAPRPPEAMASVTIWCNSGHTLRAIEGAFHRGPAMLLPRLRLVADLGAEAGPAAAPLGRLLDLSQLVARALPEAEGQSLPALTRSLADLMAEMQSEGLPPEALDAIDAADHAAHWQRALAFLRIAARFHLEGDPVDREALQRLAAERLAADWAAGRNLPGGPVIVAGSTGSHGATRLFMQAVAALPDGAVILPGYDETMPAGMLADGQDDHPQARFTPLVAAAGTPRAWTDAPPPDQGRGRLVSLALRPAPVTDQWVAEGPSLGPLADAARGMTLIEADTPAAEANAIAVLIRSAVEGGRAVTLIAADRTLTRRVTAALDRWSIRPDDSAGAPLPLTAAGLFLRHIAELPLSPLGIAPLLVLLKHPLTATGMGADDKARRAARRAHLLHTRDLELKLRRDGPAFPDGAALRRWAERGGTAPARAVWAQGIAALLDETLPLIARADALPLGEHAARHRHLAEIWAAGPGGDVEASQLYAEQAGEQARAVLDHLALYAGRGPAAGAHDFAALLADQLQAKAVRTEADAHPLVRIRGPREARTEATGLVILGGLNEGGWPQALDPDPWLSRPMRRQAGLTLPERRIGLAAHDFQIAVAAEEVVLTRARRNDEAETIPSRWLNRLVNLMAGLPGQGGPEALEGMRARGRAWLDMAAALAEPQPADRAPPAPRPSPLPPAPALSELSVTAVSRLIRDPYAVYADKVLGLRPLDPLRPQPDAAERGNVLHDIVRLFLTPPPTAMDPPEALRERLMQAADTVLARQVPWPSVRMFWRARIAAIAGPLSRQEHERLHEGEPVTVETRRSLDLPGLGFTLTARPDRIDRLRDGRAVIYDYKSGAPPTRKQMLAFDKQLPLEAAMVERGAFGAPMAVADLRYIRLGGDGAVQPRGWDDEMRATWDGFVELIGGYLSGAHGFTARRAMERTAGGSAYDQLSRHGEWSDADAPCRIEVGRD
ncbi:double-strand break repair protein AddB [Paracoccus contaminans]|uniref:Double-strand break repair protein AddB n=1 Tax=Paracoccus contaminans TaxID=1945662 RepID=A0A1W6CXG7_9RHOB|nr:double-strand break repair protein AddB [Paracoccus contaminans]ARJ69552.1 double-strand break repair protein AddB [Paracoccus contaminans]